MDVLSFIVPEGGIFGFLGGNGAGKHIDVSRQTLNAIETGKCTLRRCHSHFRLAKLYRLPIESIFMPDKD